ncbi:MAG: response regulator [Spirulina sp. DLM2.Bin59]|nr:MAG: response regulator [Spirulina sp. DLM2.Bin59]
MPLAIAPTYQSFNIDPAPIPLNPDCCRLIPDRCDILIVDPEPDIRQIVQTGLEVTTPWSVMATDSYPAGAKLALSICPRLLLINLPLAAIPRSLCLSSFQSLLTADEIRLVVMVDRVWPRDRQSLLNYGVDGIIAKPFDCNQLVALLSQWLG